MHPWPAAMTTLPDSAAPLGGLGGAAVFSGLAGITTGAGVEWLAQELETRIPKGETETPLHYKVIANTMRTSSVVVGTGLATTAALGLLGISTAAAVSVASFGVGLAIVGVVGLCFVVYRHWKKKQKESISNLLNLIVTNQNQEAVDIFTAVAKRALLNPKDLTKQFLNLIQEEEHLSVTEKTEQVRQVFQFEADHPNLFTGRDRLCPQNSSCIIL